MAVDPRLELPIPAYRGRSLGNLASTLWSLQFLAGPGPPLPPLEARLDPFEGRPPAGSVVLVLLDGLGWNALGAAAERSPDGTGSRWIEHARPITSVFPTTTTVALTSLLSGAAPAQHGVVGHRVFLPRFGTVVELLRMSPLGVRPAEALVGPDWAPEMISAVPSIFRRGARGVVLSRDRFEGSGFSRTIYDGATFVPYSTGSDLALALAETLSCPEPPPLVVVYRDDLDVVQHVRGTRLDLIDLDLERMGHILSFVARHVPPRVAQRTTLIVTGDHGQVPIAADRQLSVDREPSILEHLSRPPSGDRRAAYLSARPGHLAHLREAVVARLPPGGRIVDLPEAVESGLFGPPPFHPELSERLGDLLVLFPSPGGVSYSVPGARSRPRRMISAHGGLEAEELIVPLVSGALAELSGDRAETPHQPRHPPSSAVP